jgi:TRAP-type uncharacterized transport system substrate-binding protein
MSDGEIDALVQAWGEEDVRKAFWLQSHIKRNGLDGIDFSGEARTKIAREGPMFAKQQIEAKMREDY